MQIIKTFFESVLLISPSIFKDNRGYFFESYSMPKLQKLGLHDSFLQDNQSYSAEKFTLRGMHFQTAPYDQAKLVRCVKGEILDVFVDLRPQSPTYGKHDMVLLNDLDNQLVYIPTGFAHGFCTLVKDCIVNYKVTSLYSKDHSSGIIWNDPELAIKWPTSDPVLSDQDTKWPSFESLRRRIK